MCLRKITERLQGKTQGYIASVMYLWLLGLDKEFNNKFIAVICTRLSYKSIYLQYYQVL